MGGKPGGKRIVGKKNAPTKQEFISPTGIRKYAIKCRLDAGVSPVAIAACIHRKLSEVLAAMKDYDLKEWKPEAKPNDYLKPRWNPIVIDGVPLVCHTLMDEERAATIYALARAGQTVGQIARENRINYSSVYNFVLRNDL